MRVQVPQPVLVRLAEEIGCGTVVQVDSVAMYLLSVGDSVLLIYSLLLFVKGGCELFDQLNESLLALLAIQGLRRRHHVVELLLAQVAKVLPLDHSVRHLIIVLGLLLCSLSLLVRL